MLKHQMQVILCDDWISGNSQHSYSCLRINLFLLLPLPPFLARDNSSVVSLPVRIKLQILRFHPTSCHNLRFRPPSPPFPPNRHISFSDSCGNPKPAALNGFALGYSAAQGSVAKSIEF